MNEERSWCIYLLEDHRVEDFVLRVRYVGKTVNLKNRTIQLSEETKQKLRNRVVSEETRAKMRESRLRFLEAHPK